MTGVAVQAPVSLLARRPEGPLVAFLFWSAVVHAVLLSLAVVYAKLHETPPLDLDQKPIRATLVRQGTPRDEKLLPRIEQPPPPPLEQKAPEPVAAPPAPPAKPRILFVDDDERILNGVRALFRQDYEVDVANSAAGALEILARGGVHVIVSDQRMPAMTGVELLRQARAVSPNTVRLLLTGYSDLAALVGSINEGEIFRFVHKPWENDALRKDVGEAMEAAMMKLAAPPPPAKAPSPRSAGSLLVIDAKEGLGRGLERLLAGAATVVQVRNPAEAAKALAANEFAAIVADLGGGMDGLVQLIKQVKAKRPAVHTILLADEPDSELGIELVNRAQIFRFLPKPVSAKDLRHQVAEALRRYAVLKESAKGAGGGGGGAEVAAPTLAARSA